MRGVVNHNLNRRIRQTLYTLKRMFGSTIYLSKKTNVDTNYTTGVKTQNEWTWRINRAVVMPVSITREALQSISMISANKQFMYGGTYDIGTRIFIIDAQDTPRDLTIETDDWLVYNDKRYQIKVREELEQATGWIVTAREVEGINTPVVFVHTPISVSEIATNGGPYLGGQTHTVALTHEATGVL